MDARCWAPGAVTRIAAELTRPQSFYQIVNLLFSLRNVGTHVGDENVAADSLLVLAACEKYLRMG